MSKKYKYIMNMGLAFDEERAMKKLSEMAKEGWILEEMTIFRYKLAKHEPSDLVYTMDYKRLDGDKSEYFELFKSSGWNHMCSYGAFHFFAGSPDIVPIYTDKKSYLEKYSNYKSGCKKSALVTTIILLLTLILQVQLDYKIDGTITEFALRVIGIVSGAFLLPSIMMFIAYSLKGKRTF